MSIQGGGPKNGNGKLPTSFTSVRVADKVAPQKAPSPTTPAKKTDVTGEVELDAFKGDSFDGGPKSAFQEGGFGESGINSGTFSQEPSGPKGGLAMRKMVRSTLRKLQHDISEQKKLGSDLWREQSLGGQKNAPLRDRLAAFADKSAELKDKLRKAKLRKRQVKLKAAGKAQKAPTTADIAQLKATLPSGDADVQQLQIAQRFTSGAVLMNVQGVDDKAQLASDQAAFAPSGVLAETMLRLLSDFAPAQRPTSSSSAFAALIVDPSA